MIAHIDGCSSCKRLRAKLESKERAFRSALAAFGSDREGASCPSPAEIATIHENGLDSADADLVEHLARCGACRSTLSVLSNAAAAASLETSDVTLAAARRRVGIARAKSDTPSKSGRVPSGRRRTTRQVALIEDRSSRAGLIAAAVACFLVAFGFFAFVRDSGPPPADETATEQKPSAPKDLPQPPVEQPKPVEKAPVIASPNGSPHASPTPPPAQQQPPEEPVVAMNTPRANELEQEPQPAEPETQPVAQPPAPTAPQPEVKKPTNEKGPNEPKTTETPAPTPTPKQQPAGTPTAPRLEPGTLACLAVTGPMEVRHKAEKTWKKLSISDLVRDGDALRAKGEDGSITFGNGRSSLASVNFDADATGTVTVTARGVKIQLESGGLESNTLAYNGLEVSETNGTVTAWKGSKVRLEITEKGLRVCVDKGTANAGNDLGAVTVHAGQEIVLVKDKKPERPATTHGPYRTPRGK